MIRTIQIVVLVYSFKTMKIKSFIIIHAKLVVPRTLVPRTSHGGQLVNGIWRRLHSFEGFARTMGRQNPQPQNNTPTNQGPRDVLSVRHEKSLTVGVLSGAMAGRTQTRLGRGSDPRSMGYDYSLVLDTGWCAARWIHRIQICARILPTISCST